jgi:hypothetical protein
MLRPPKSSLAAMSSAPAMLANLTPMKRILCLCPVEAPSRMLDTKRTNDDENVNRKIYHIGMAVSDPYLSCASTIMAPVSPWEVLWYTTRSASGAMLGLSKDQLFRQVKNTFPVTAASLMDEIGYTDVGAVALGLPIFTLVNSSSPDSTLESKQKDDDESVAIEVREYLLSFVLERYWEQNNTFAGSSGLACYVNERLSLEQATHMAREEPEMWEDVEIDQDCGNNLHPSVHACVALNHFLWEHTGGWQNTLG